MSQLGRVLTLTSAAATDYTNASVQNAGELESLVLPSLGDTARARVLRVTLRAAENRIYDVLFFSTSTGAGATQALNRFLGRVNFALADGVQIAGAGLWLYSAACDIPVRDDGKGSAIHCMVVNRSVTALTGGANSLVVELALDETNSH